ncbi:TlyA family RNA methyltransferase [Rarobacter faecitabidus]|uniref:TlyA family RNA methyltransferase n=1 Tax=Rarobacter faecitabidus TaxID=13243 RepID=UPI003CCC7BAF
MGEGETSAVQRPERGGLRLDAALVARGIASSRTRAHALVKRGAVQVGGEIVTRASRLVREDDPIVLLQGEDAYVSRAAHKLLGFLADLGDRAPRIEGTACLDVGASTGGFTQVLLERGAREVVTLDVGHGQLDGLIRADARVRNIEGFNARDLAPAHLPSAPGLIVSDVSFISLTYLIAPLRNVIEPGGRALLLIKPQFEVGRANLGSGGVVRDPELHRQAIVTVVECAMAAGFAVGDIAPSRLPGPAGNIEYFVDLTAAHGVERDGQSERLPPADASADLARRIDRAVAMGSGHPGKGVER